MSFSYENCEVCGTQTIESASFRGLSLCNKCKESHEIVDNWTLIKKENKVKFEQVFDNYKVVMDFGYGSGYFWKISVVENEYYGSEVLGVTKCERGVKVGTSRTLPVDGSQAFELANMYQEALALANTKNLSVDLFLELGYSEVK